MYYIYELVEGPDYPALKSKQSALALITAKSLFAPEEPRCSGRDMHVRMRRVGGGGRGRYPCRDGLQNPVDSLYPIRVRREVERGLADVPRG